MTRRQRINVKPDRTSRPRGQIKGELPLAAATTIALKRAVFYGVLSYAVELELLPANPIGKVTWKAPEVAEEIDRRVVARPTPVRQLLAPVTDIGPDLAAFFGCLYYAAVRSCHVAPQRLREPPRFGLGHAAADRQCSTGWLRLDRFRQRSRRAALEAPCQEGHPPGSDPARAGDLLREHIGGHGTAADGRLFHGRQDAMLSESIYGRVWQRARATALTPAQATSPLAARPYDLRHSGIT